MSGKTTDGTFCRMLSEQGLTTINGDLPQLHAVQATRPGEMMTHMQRVHGSLRIQRHRYEVSEVSSKLQG